MKALSARLHRHRFLLLIVLLVLWLLSSLWIFRDPRPLPFIRMGGASESEAAQVESILSESFGLRLDNSMALVLEAGHRASPELMKQLRAFPHVQEVLPIPGEKHRNALYYIQLDQDMPVMAAEALVPEMRELLKRWSQHSGVETWLTGQQAFFYDMGKASQEDAASTEKWGLLFAFVVLVFCFGSLSAAALPLVMGASTLLMTQIALRLLALGTNQTALILNSMLGLGLSIDYSLFMVSRYREERQHRPPIEAIEQVLKHTGRTIVYSALVMLAALVTLLLPEVQALRGTVKNLILVVSLSALNAVTVLPIVLLTLDPFLDRPRTLARQILRLHNPQRWEKLARHVTQHARVYCLISLLILGGLAWPATQMRLWEPLQALAPKDSESVRGVEQLAADGWGGEVLPVQVILSAPEGQSLLEEAQLREIYTLSQALLERPEVQAVRGLVNPKLPLEDFLSLYRQWQIMGPLLPQHPLLRSRGQHEVTLLSIFQEDPMDVQQSYAILNWLHAYAQTQPKLQIQSGGIVARAQSFTREMYRQVPLMLGLVLGSILILLSIYLRSWVLPIKAGIMNFLPILSAFGILVWAFQWGGLESHAGIINIVPVTLFCIVFGLSMDYEVLILSRMDEHWRQHGQVREAVVHGLSSSSGIITGAALILLGVFSPGIFSSSPIVREISLGISATILLDATVVRLLLVPSMMMLMGRWNWWKPGAQLPFRADLPPGEQD